MDIYPKIDHVIEPETPYDLARLRDEALLRGKVVSEVDLTKFRKHVIWKVFGGKIREKLDEVYVRVVGRQIHILVPMGKVFLRVSTPLPDSHSGGREHD